MTINTLGYIHQAIEIVYITFLEISHDVRHFAKLTYWRITLLVTRDAQHVAFKKDGSDRLIIFIHGYLGDRKNFTYLAENLKDFGNQLFISYNSVQDLSASAKSIKQVIDHFLIENPRIRNIGIVSHSMGGLVANDLIYHQDPGRKYDFCITLGTPFKGTDVARMGFGVSASQMKPENLFIQTLWESIHKDPKTHHLTLAAEQDYIVRRHNEATAFLDCSTKKYIPTTHLGLLQHSLVLEEVKHWIHQYASH